MAEYNLSEFRSNTRKAFDEAERGEPVYIERYGEDFILISKKNWNDTMALQSKGVSTLVTDEVSSNIRPDIKTVTPPTKKNNFDPQADENKNGLPGVDEL